MFDNIHQGSYLNVGFNLWKDFKIITLKNLDEEM